MNAGDSEDEDRRRTASCGGLQAQERAQATAKAQIIARTNHESCRNVSAGTGTGEAVGKDTPAVARLKHKALIKYNSCSVDDKVHTTEEGPRVL